MTTPTNSEHSDNRQTSERERLAVACEQSGQLHLVEIAQLRAERDEAFRMSRCECGANECCANLVKHSDEISQLRMDLARLRLTHTETAANLAAADEQARTSDEIITALRAENGRLLRERASEDVRLADVIAERDRLRAENEALRTVTPDDVEGFLTALAEHGCRGVEYIHYAEILTALQSFIRSKESRRG